MDKRFRTPIGSLSAEDTGRRIDSWLAHHNLSARAASRLTGIPHTTLQWYRLGKMRPSREAMKKLAVIGLTERYVYGREADLDNREESICAEKAAFISWYENLDEDTRQEVEDLAQLLFGYRA